MIYLVISVIVLFIIFSLHYFFHLANTIVASRAENGYKPYGWGTIFIFKNLYNSKIFSRSYGASYFTSDNKSRINKENEFLFNDIFILFDPISFVLIKSFCWWKYLNDGFLNSNLFKTYTKIESEKILEKLTSD